MKEKNLDQAGRTKQGDAPLRARAARFVCYTGLFVKSASCTD